MNRPVPYGSCIRAGPGFLPNLASVIARAGNPGPAFCFTEPRRGRGAGQDAQFPCESRVLLPGCGLLPLETSLPGLPLLSPGTPLTLSGAIRCSNSSTFRSISVFIAFSLFSHRPSGPGRMSWPAQYLIHPHCSGSPSRGHRECGCAEKPEDSVSVTHRKTQGPVDTLPPVPSFPGLFVLLRGGLLFPGLPVALGAIRSSNSSTSSRTWSFILSHLLSVVLDLELNRSPRYPSRHRRGTPGDASR